MVLPPALSAIGALAAVLGLVFLAARVARRSGLALSGPGNGRRLVVRDTLTLDRARRLLVVQCDGRELLLLTGGQSDVVVGWLPGAGE